MAVDLKELEKQADDLGLEGESRTQFLSIFQHEKSFENLKKRGLRLDEFSRKIDTELNPAKAKLEETRLDLTAQLDALGRLRDETTGEVTKTREEIGKAERKAFDAEQALRRIATDAGLDADAYLTSLGMGTTKEPPVKESKIDTSTFVDRKSFGDGIRTSVMTTADLMRVNSEHRKLFGDDLPDPDEIVNYVIAQGAKGRDLSIRQAWEEKHKVSDKRAEVANADIDRRIKDAVGAAEVRVRSEMAMGSPGQRPEQMASPALQLAKASTRGNVSDHLMKAAGRLSEVRAKLAAGTA